MFGDVEKSMFMISKIKSNIDINAVDDDARDKS